MTRILIAIACFAVGTALSAGWRMANERGRAVAVKSSDAARSAPLARGAAQPDSKPVFGRLESIAGLTAALTAPAGSTAAKAMEEWARRLCVTDAFLACEMLLKSPKSDARDKALKWSLLEAAKTDPFRAHKIFSKLGITDTEGTWQRLVTMMTRKDPKLTWDTLTADGGKISKLDVESIAKEWGRTQGFAAAAFGLTLRDPIQRAIYLRQALPAWAVEDTVSFAKWFQQQPAELLLERYVNFQSLPSDKSLTLASLDAAVALNLPVASSSLKSAFESAWRNPALREEAPAWIALQKDPSVRDAAWEALAHEYLKSDIAHAAELLPQIQNETARRRVSSTIAAETSKTDPLGAMDFAATLTDEDARTKAQASALATWAKHQPAESLAYAREHAASLPAEHLRSSASEWGQTQPAATIEFLLSLPSVGTEDYYLKSVIFDWVRRRPDEVDAWLSKAGSGPATDAVMKVRNKPVENSKISGHTIHGPNGITEIHYGGSGKSSTSATINGRTVNYFY